MERFGVLFRRKLAYLPCCGTARAGFEAPATSAVAFFDFVAVDAVEDVVDIVPTKKTTKLVQCGTLWQTVSLLLYGTPKQRPAGRRHQQMLPQFQQPQRYGQPRMRPLERHCRSNSRGSSCSSGFATTLLQQLLMRQQRAEALMASTSSKHFSAISSTSHHTATILFPRTLLQQSLSKRFATNHTCTTTRSFVSLTAKITKRSVSNHVEAANNNNNATNTQNVIPFVLADIGEGIAEVEVLQWYVHPGDVIHQFDKVCEVQSDKATVEITSRYDGIVTSVAHDGATGVLVSVGQPLLYLQQQQQHSSTAIDSLGLLETHNDSGTLPTRPSNINTSKLHDVAASRSTIAGLLPEERLSIPTVASQYHVASDIANVESTLLASTNNLLPPQPPPQQMSPAVRRLGRTYGLDLATIRGTGPAGRLLKSDVVTYLREQRGIVVPNQHPLKAVVSVPPPTVSTMTLTPQSLQVQDNDNNDDVNHGDVIIPLRGYSRQMIKTMTAALQTPHMCFGDEILMDALILTRQQLNATVATTAGTTKISLLALLIKAVSCALLDHPMVNAVVHSVSDGTIRQCRDHHIGIAMDTPRGLVVPVLRACQRRSVSELSLELDRLKTAAAAGRVDACDLPDNDTTTITFTLSNIGSMGAGSYMVPVLAPPALAMGALGRIKTVPRFLESSSATGMTTTSSVDIGKHTPKFEPAALPQLYAAQVMTVTWAADHRFLDGATLGRFHRSFARYVECPTTLLARLR